MQVTGISIASLAPLERYFGTQNPPPQPIDMTSPLLEHAIDIRVRYPETDPMGYLHHSRYFIYFEMGRTELLRASGGNYRRMEEEGIFVVAVKVDCQYRRPARYDDLLTLRTQVLKTTNVRIEHEYRLFRDEELLAVGHTTLAVVNTEGQIQPVPEWLRIPAEPGL